MNDDEIDEVIKELSSEYEIKRKKPRNQNARLTGTVIILWVLVIINILGTIYIIHLLRG